MPPENLGALKEFLRLKRATEAKKELETTVLGHAFRGLPAQNRRELLSFLSDTLDVYFLRPDGEPKPGWKVIRCKSVEEAKKRAFSAAAIAHGIESFSLEWFSNAVNTLVTTPPALRAARDAAWQAASKAKRAGVLSDAISLLGITTENMPPRARLNDAQLMVELIVTRDLEFEGKEQHTAVSRACWEVWRKGYTLLGVIDGTTYVHHSVGAAT